MALLNGIWNGLRALVGLVLPFFAKARDFPHLGRLVRWTIHFILLALILVLLWWVGERIQFHLILTKGPERLRHFWLPIFFLVIYVIAWLSWWLWKLLLPEETSSYFPDIDAAWEEAMSALAQTRIDLSSAPLYLVLGRSHYGEDALFASSKINFAVRGAPAHPDAPIRVFAHPDGIFVTCAGASLLGQQAALIAAAAEQPARAGQPKAVAQSQLAVGQEDFNPYATLRPGGLSKDVQEILSRAQGRELTPDERRQLRILTGAAGEGPSAPSTSVPLALIRSQAQIETLTARLQHLCSLIVRDRRPFCPINGVVVLAPWTGMESDEVANQLANFCHLDLAAAQGVFQMYFPTVALVCDMERASGFREFLRLLPAGHIRDQRIGQRFPLVHDLDLRGLTEKLEDLARFICRDGALVKLIYRMFRIESPEKESLQDVLASNAQVYFLLAELHERYRRLGRFLSRGIGESAPSGIYFGGCYLGATGFDPGEQAFVPGFFERLFNRNEKFDENISWTAAALEEDATYHRWSRNGYLALAIVVLVLGGAVGWWWLNRGS